MRRSLWGPLLAVVLAGGCDDAPKAQTAAPSPAVRRPAPPPARPAAPRAEPEPPDLVDEDFVSTIDRNRDPFRSYLNEFATPMRPAVKIQRKALLDRYALEELQLIAVVTGRGRPMAMFRDPTGLGISVTRGDYVSKSFARVKQILPDKVIVQIEEYSEEQQRVADRVIPLTGGKK